MSRESTDILVLGGGIAGLSFALRAAEFADVTIAAKAEFEESNTWYAQGGIAAVVDPADTLEQHVQDTLTAGAGLCHEATVRRVIESGPSLIDDLVRWGVRFTQGVDEAWDLGREGGTRRGGSCMPATSRVPRSAAYCSSRPAGTRKSACSSAISPSI